jgi:hypothetical protein
MINKHISWIVYFLSPSKYSMNNLRSNKQSVSIAHEAVRYFIKRFNGKVVFKDSNVNCPNILNQSTLIGMKMFNLMHIKQKTPNGQIDIDDEAFDQIGFDDLKTILKLCYLEFSLNQDEKDKSNTFEYITKVYKEMLTLVQQC